MKKQWVVGLAITLLTVLTACGGNNAGKDSGNEQVLRVGEDSELSTADVSLAMDNTAVSVMSQIGEGLYSLNKNGEAVPALAEEIVEPTNDGLTYTFKLKKEAKWSNGDPITAKDFEYSWKRTVKGETASPQAYYFSGIKNYEEVNKGTKDVDEFGVKALDDHTFEVNLSYPMSYFQQLIAVPAFFPLNQKFVEATGKPYGTNAESTLYNGPFVLEDWNGSSISWTYKKNKEYWDQENVKLDKIEVEVIKEAPTGKNLFDGGQLDKVKISGELVAQEEGSEALKLREISGTYYIQLNTQKGIFKNAKARQAVAMALDSEQLATKILNDGSQKALGFVPKGFLNHNSGKDFAEEVGDINKTDLDKAKKLWEEAKQELNTDDFSGTLLCSDTESAKKISEYVQSTANEVLSGLKLEVSSVPFNNRLQKSRDGDFDIVLGGWTPVYADPIDFLDLLHSSTANNFGKWGNAKYDQLVDDAKTTYGNDYEKRWNSMQEADKVIGEEAPVVPLFQITEAYLINSRVKNLELGTLGATYYKNVYIEE